jgi:hypothetical protein
MEKIAKNFRNCKFRKAAHSKQVPQIALAQWPSYPHEEQKARVRTPGNFAVLLCTIN